MPNEIEDVLDLDLNKIAAYDNPDELPASKKATASSVKSEKPNKVEWFRTRKDVQFLPGLFVELADADGLKEQYLVYGTKDFQEHLKKLLPGSFNTRLLVPYKNNIGQNGIWPISTYKSERYANKWTTSALEASELAKDRWTRIAANMAAGHYTIWDPGTDLSKKFGEVEFEIPYSKTITLAFHRRILTEDNYKTFDPLVRACGGGIIETATE